MPRPPLPEGRAPDAIEAIPRPDRRRRIARRLRRAAIALLALGVLLGAGWAGWTARDRFGEKPPIVVRHDVKLVSDAPAADGTAPSVVGLELPFARQAMADAGAQAAKIRVEQRPYVGPAGVVVAQDPPPAARLAGLVTLTASTPARMPNLVGRSRTAARQQLERLGATLRMEPSFRPAAEGQQVLRTEPAAGETVPEEVTIVYAEPESSVNLADVEPETSDCAVGDRELGGSERTAALVCNAGSGASSAVWDVGGHGTRLTAEVGLADDAPDGTRAVARVRSAGRTIASVRLVAGRTERIEVLLDRTRELTLQVRGLGDETGDVVWADLTLYGSRRGLDELLTP